jgi:hypothetical protein
MDSFYKPFECQKGKCVIHVSARKGTGVSIWIDSTKIHPTAYMTPSQFLEFAAIVREAETVAKEEAQP